MARITSGRCPASPLATNAGGAAPANARSCRPAATIRICRGQARPCSDRLPAVEGRRSRRPRQPRWVSGRTGVTSSSVSWAGDEPT